ncbi:DUF6658 family protein [Pantanalinema sp. GBBB05]|uniref:DUF6658 family protein n=1 Tax=Pantanalinema sp. GBBB05 TaxID=2604139 RepID=UPI001DE2DE01|nr:hypothetical protein [Pantanalinema sp. GBBB05]
MRQLMAALKQLQFGKLVTAFLMGVVLLIATACNSGNELGARPNNPPVQMGGQNNPHKMGGDTYSQYKMSTDAKAKKSGDRASLMQSPSQLVAASYTNENSSRIQYPGSSRVESARSKDDFASREQQKKLMNPGQIPAQRQPIVDRSDPNAKLLEKTGQTFKDAGSFLKQPAKDTRYHSDLEQVNPDRR